MLPFDFRFHYIAFPFGGQTYHTKIQPCRRFRRFALKAGPRRYIQARRACAKHCRCRLCLPLFCRIYHTKSCIAARRLHLCFAGGRFHIHSCLLLPQRKRRAGSYYFRHTHTAWKRRLHLLRFVACLYFHHRNIRFRYSFHPLFWQRSFGFAYIPFGWIRCIHPFVHRDKNTIFAIRRGCYYCRRTASALACL